VTLTKKMHCCGELYIKTEVDMTQCKVLSRDGIKMSHSHLLF